jgi:hypothetical protein
VPTSSDDHRVLQDEFFLVGRLFPANFHVQHVFQQFPTCDISGLTSYSELQKIIITPIGNFFAVILLPFVHRTFCSPMEISRQISPMVVW